MGHGAGRRAGGAMWVEYHDLRFSESIIRGLWKWRMRLESCRIGPPRSLHALQGAKTLKNRELKDMSLSRSFVHCQRNPPQPPATAT